MYCKVGKEKVVKSYLEVTWLLNGAVCAGLWSMTLTLQKKNRCGISSVALICTILCWVVRSQALCFFIRLLFSVIMYGFCVTGIIQFLLMMEILLRFFSQFDCFVLKNGLLYCDIVSWEWLLIVSFFFLAMVFRFDLLWLKRKSELYVPVCLESKYDTIQCIGYLDTGNCMMHNGFPVVFVSIPIQCDTWISVQSVTGTSRLNAVEATVQLRKKKYDVMMAYAQQLQVECLLHVMMK